MLWNKSRRPRNRRKDDKGGLCLPAINWKRWMPAMLVLVAVLGATFAIRVALNQPLRTVAVEGRFQRVQPLDVEKAVRQRVGKQGVVAVNLNAVSAAVRQIPWVDRATVARAWPSGLRVFVVEQTPVARWGESGLLNTRGELFVNDARHIPPELPELVGPTGSQSLMTTRYLAVQGRLEEAGMRLTQLRLDERGAWEFVLDNGVRLRLGRLQVDERFDRFMAAAARIVASRADEIAYVDLRYATGFAIGWKVKGSEVASG
ncbi:MAG: cell division protein FtsQ/DivIB [Pseudomonadota bacterium]